MSDSVKITIHSSQFPAKAQADLLQSLRTRQIHHKFLYESVKQTQKWLALHEACSPARTDPNCAEIYDLTFAAVADACAQAARVHVIGLGCGGGQKEVRLLQLLKGQGKTVSYTPCDVSLAMVLVAQQTARAVISESGCYPLVCDLAACDELPALLASQDASPAARLVTFFGMIPNFEPNTILPRLAGVLRVEDRLLLNANLAPGSDYAAGIARVLPLYDNDPTRDWLLTFLFDLGIEPADGELRFSVQDCPAGSGLKRIEANFHFVRPRAVKAAGERIAFPAGGLVRLFFSYRYTPDRVRRLLRQNGLTVLEQWITRSEEEGVFLCRRTA